jgi:urea transporter
VITEAEPSHTDQLRTRQKRYLIMMGTRIVCLVVAAVAYSLKAMWAVPVCIVGMVVLPWMAVLIANDRPPLRDRRLPRTAGRPTGDRAIEAADRERVIDQ